MQLNKTISNYTILGIILILLAVSNNLNWGKNNWKDIIESDGRGYYAYLPAIFIYNDLNFNFFEQMDKKKYFNESLIYDYRKKANDKNINKYYFGTALAQMPFFLVAHGLTKISSLDTDGYSKLYLIFVNIATIFYLFIGILYLQKLLKLYNISDRNISFTLITAVFGTNLFYYTVGEPSMSHVYSFGFMSMFLYFTKSYFAKFESNKIFILVFLLGLIVLIRPINGIIVFAIPFISSSFSTLKEGIKFIFNNKSIVLLCFLIFFSIVSLQLIIYKISTGNFIIYSYKEEGFNFLSPQFFNILFSYRKGLFLYTPIYLISFVGGYYIFKKSKFEFITWLGVFILITYIFSSWWMWYYGGSFSSRVYIEFIPLFMIFWATYLQENKNSIHKKIFLILNLTFIIICQIQTYQYRYYQIHWDSMDKEKYWDVFLRIDKLIF